MEFQKNCVHCGKPFTTHMEWKKYCSPDCKNAYKIAHNRELRAMELVTKKCPHCGLTFTTHLKFKIYCSDDCYVAAMKNRVAKQQAQRRAEKSTQIAVAEVTKEPPKLKTLDDWLNEAAECGLDYGNYRAQVELLGKTFEQLKAQAGSNGISYLGSKIHAR